MAGIVEQASPPQAATLPTSMEQTRSSLVKKKQYSFCTLFDGTSHCLIGCLLYFFEVIPVLKPFPKFEKISAPSVSGHNPESKTVHHLVIIIFKRCKEMA